MNGMGSPLGAMLQGISQGDAQARSIMPNAYQPQGKAAPRNPWQGSIDLVVDQILSLSHQIREQGDKYRDISVDFQKAANMLAKCNVTLNDLAEGENSDNGGY